MTVKVTQSCPTLCDPIDYIICGILQARILEWVAVPFSSRSSQPADQSLSLMSPALAGGFFTTIATWEAQIQYDSCPNKKRKRKKKLHSICRVILEIIDIFIFSLPIHEYGLSLLFKHCQYISIKCYNFLKNLNS